MPFNALLFAIFFLFSPMLMAFQTALTLDTGLLQPNPDEQWQSIDSPHFVLHYRPKNTDFTHHLAFIAESVHHQLTPLMKWTPKRKTHIVVNDTTDQSNGAAIPLPYNQFYIYMSAPTQGELLDQTSWSEQVFTHEYTHILHLDQVAGKPALLRNLFGRTTSLLTPFTFPELFAPHWSSEGIAIYAESQKGFGRNHNGIFESKMRLEVQRGLRSFSEESYEGYSNSRWPFGQVYLYGAYFYQFVADTYGKDKVIEYITQYNNHLIPWRMNQRAKQTFGLSNADLWHAFQSYLATRFQPQIKQIAQKGITQGRSLNETPFYNHLLTRGPNNAIIYYHDDRISEPQIRQALPNGEITTLLAMGDVTDLDWDNQQGLLISKQSICRNKNQYNDLYQYQPSTQTLTRLTECARLPRAKWHPNHQDIFAIHLNGGHSDLVKVEAKGHLLRYTQLKAEETLGQFDISADGQQVVASLHTPDQGWQLALLNLSTLKWQLLTHNSEKPSNPQFNTANDQVYYLADTAQQVELKSIALNNQTITTWSNSLGHVVDYALIDTDTQPSSTGFWLSEYESEQHQLKWVAQPTQFNVQDGAAQTPPNLAQLIPPQANSQVLANARDYNPMETLRPTGWVPFYRQTDNTTQAGASFMGQDILGFHQYSLTPLLYRIHANGESQANEAMQLGGTLSYRYHQKYEIDFNRDITQLTFTNATPTNDTTWLQAAYTQHINQDSYTAKLTAGFTYQTDSLTDDKLQIKLKQRSVLSGIQGHYNTVSLHPHGISLTDGWVTNLALESYLAGDYSGQFASIQASHYHDFGQGRTLKLSGFFGQGGANTRPMQLGAFYGVNTELPLITRIGQRNVPLRGYPLHEQLRATQVQSWTLEYRKPLTRLYDGFNNVPLGLGKLSGRVFFDTGATQKLHYYNTLGAELCAEWLIGYDSITLPIALGVAQGLDKQLGESQIYLQLGMGF